MHRAATGTYQNDLTPDWDAGKLGINESVSSGAKGQLERIAGLEPAHAGWKPAALPTELYPLINGTSLNVVESGIADKGTIGLFVEPTA